jgi:hypothetical protein
MEITLEKPFTASKQAFSEIIKNQKSVVVLTQSLLIMLQLIRSYPS